MSSARSKRNVVRAGLIGCIAASAAIHLVSAAAPSADDPRKFTVKLTLTPAQTAPLTIATVDVDLVFDTWPSVAGEPLLQLPLIADNVDTIASTVADLTVKDARGSLSLTSRDVDLPVEDARDSDTGGRTREWFSDRSPEGAITVHYSVPAVATLPPRGPTGPLAFRNDDGGTSAAGNIFLLMPPGAKHRYVVRTSWDLSKLPPGAIGISSLGEGEVVSTAPMTSAELRESYFMGGLIHRWPDHRNGSDFFSAWQGSPPFDAASLMQWTSQLHQHYQAFFKQAADRPYGVSLRYNPVNAGGGTGFFQSFVATYGAGRGQDIQALKTLLAHEMFHTFQPYITRPAGKESSWFGEGLADFYEARLPLRYGLISPKDFLVDLNFSAARYYSSIMATQPNSVVAEHFWDDTRIRTLPYDRGMLYFATVDDAVRKHSQGKRSLDTLLLRMLALEDQGRDLSNADWEEVLRSELGESAVRAFHEFLNGKRPVPASDAFGACFSRTTTRVRRYELGFTPAVLREPRRIVRGLMAGSAADHAGLKDGDEITKPVPQDGIQGNQTELLKLDIRRGDRKFEISYLPRGEEVEVYQWRRASGSSGRTCGL
jgi:hypothetical protein